MTPQRRLNKESDFDTMRCAATLSGGFFLEKQPQKRLAAVELEDVDQALSCSSGCVRGLRQCLQLTTAPPREKTTVSLLPHRGLMMLPAARRSHRDGEAGKARKS